MISFELTARIIDGEVYFPMQNEVENLSIFKYGHADFIYHEKIFLSEMTYVEWCDEQKAWKYYGK